MAGGPLFEQGGDLTPNLARRVAWGAAGIATSNSTWQTVVDWLLTVLGFLKIEENLADLNNPTTARTNLDVYSTGILDAALLLKADKSNVLQKDNTTTYVPTQQFHPATKAYADAQFVGKLVYAARILWNDTTINVTEFVNDSFIGTIEEKAANELGLNLSTPDAGWQTNLEIQATSNPDSTTSRNRNPHFFFDSSSYISLYLVDSGGSAQDDGGFWIRIYDWS